MHAWSVRGRDTNFLNGFRGLAAFWVVIAHCLIWGGFADGKFPSPKLAVDVFMILSGFLMVYTIEHGRGSPDDASTWMRFYLRRFFRIAPGYYAVFAAMVLLIGPVSDGLAFLQTLDPAHWPVGGTYDPRTTKFDLTNILLHMTFLFGLHPSYSFSSMMGDWSLSLEMQFYAVFPLIYLAMRRTNVLLASWGLALLAIAIAMAYQSFGLPAFEEPSFLPMKLPVFMAGILIYEATEQTGPRLASSFAMLFFSALPLDGWDALLLALAATVAAIWIWQPPAATKLARFKVVGFMCDCSYAAFLLHVFSIALIGAPLVAWLLSIGVSYAASVVAMTVLVVITTYAASWPFYLLIERPGIDLGKRVGSRRAQ